MRYSAYRLSGAKFASQKIKWGDVAFWSVIALGIFVWCIGTSTINMYGSL